MSNSANLGQPLRCNSFFEKKNICWNNESHMQRQPLLQTKTDDAVAVLQVTRKCLCQHKTCRRTYSDMQNTHHFTICGVWVVAFCLQVDARGGMGAPPSEKTCVANWATFYMIKFVQAIRQQWLNVLKTARLMWLWSRELNVPGPVDGNALFNIL